jgi:hypothetical protein
VTVCEIVLSPFVGEVVPSSAAYVPEWLVVLIVSDAPLVVQPLNVPVSNPPLTTTDPPPPAGLTVSVTAVECVALAAVPVTVTVYVPAGVDAAVLIVSVDDPPAVTELGFKLAVAPDGSPLALSDIDCADPLVTAVEMVDVAPPPCVTDTLAGLAVIEKSLATTVSDRVVECVALAPVPVTVTVYVPAGVVAAVLIVSVDDPPAVTELGLKLAVAPEGSPLALSDTDCAEPLVTAVEIVEVAVPPWFVDTLAGAAAIEKSFPGGAAGATLTSSNSV